MENLRAVWQRFFAMDAAGGIILVIAAAAAMIVANSALAPFYHDALHATKFHIGVITPEGGGWGLQKDLLHWINDGLMAIFFFLIGLEIKREILEGELSSRARLVLPLLAAIGGMMVPAALYYFVNMDTPQYAKGWAIPAATDIAFALGVLALLGSRAPVALKIILTAIAIIDDLGAIIIIALFYGHGFSAQPLIVAGLALAVLFTLNRARVTSLAPYILVGFVMWAAVLESGVHATLAGVLTALFIPLRDPARGTDSPLKRLEHMLHPWVAFAVLPVFAFANAGVSLQGVGLDVLGYPLTLGIMVGLFFGKQIGIFGVIWLVVKSGLSPMPENTNWWQLYAMAVLCGIGFTMSLFIGGLAFPAAELQAPVRVGVLGASVLSAALGYWLLRYGPARMKD